MACSCSHLTGCGGDQHHDATELLLFHSASGELEGSEEEDGPLQNIVERDNRLHASDKVCAGEGKHLKVGSGVLGLTVFSLEQYFVESMMKRHLMGIQFYTAIFM